jgi:hypothetical protein
MKSIVKALLAAAGIAAFAFSPANAYEAGFENQTKPGIFIGASAGMPPPGVYMFNQVFSYQSNLAGPGKNTVFGGRNVGDQAAVDIQGFIFVPGWTFLGATYDALIVQPFVMASAGDPLNVQASGVHNTYFTPVELTWKLPSGFAVKTGFSFYAPTGTIQGPAGNANVGAPFWTWQPELAFSYLANGWNLTAFLYDEINTANSRTNYTTGNIFHADFTFTKTIGKWTFGPVAYYVAQITDDKCPVGTCTAFYGPGGPGAVGGPVSTPTGTILANAQRYQAFAIGGLIGYDFGPASFSVWATQEVFTKASNAAAIAASGADPSLITAGSTVLATLSYRLWAPEEPAKAPMFHK